MDDIHPLFNIYSERPRQCRLADQIARPGAEYLNAKDIALCIANYLDESFRPSFKIRLA
jgi:hypothetical protein